MDFGPITTRSGPQCVRVPDKKKSGGSVAFIPNINSSAAPLAGVKCSFTLFIILYPHPCSSSVLCRLSLFPPFCRRLVSPL